MYKHTQRSFAGGRLDAELMGRQDLAKYFQGASELKNFTVRRQGYISKRRGTDLACDLKNLLGHTDVTETVDGEEVSTSVPNTISDSRLFPLVNDKESGYYVLITAGRAFLASRRGIRLMDGTWSSSIADYELADYATADVADDKRPYYVAVPYADSELHELSVVQSGDTMFIAHRRHRPAKIFRDGETLEFSYLELSAGKWFRPAILSATKSGVDTSGGGTVSVSYVCTYVKDGVESEPSVPIQVSYLAPWRSGGTITLKCGKGNNTEDPDYYNVYKAEHGEYGLIQSVKPNEQVFANPEIGGCTGVSIGDVTCWLRGNDNRSTFSIGAANVSQLINQSSSPVLPTGSVQYFNYYGRVCFGIYGRGGAYSANGVVTFDFGDSSGLLVSKLEVTLDTYSFYSLAGTNNSTNYYLRHYAGPDYYRLKVTCRTIPSDGGEGVEHVFSPDDYQALNLNVVSADINPGGSYTTNPHDHYLDSLYMLDNPLTSVYSSVAEVAAQVRASERHLSFEFGDVLKNYYSALSGSPRFQVTKLELSAYADNQYTTPAAFYWCNANMFNTITLSDTVTDQYDTPDMSLTPPRSEEHFAGAGEYPGCVGIYQQRLCFAASQNDPSTLWMSAVGDLYNFSPHSSIREDDPLTVTLAATELPSIDHIVYNRDLMLFAAGGEWQIAPVSGNSLTYKTVSAKLQSVIGCAQGLPPMSVGDEIVFADQTGQRLYATRYNWSSDGYESNDLSVLSQWLFKNNPITSLCYRQHPDSVVVCALKDGTMAELVYMKEHEVCAWSRTTLGGGFRARGVATNKSVSNGSSEVMLLVERDGAFALWRQRDDIPVRSGVVEAADHLCMDGARELASGETAASDETVVDCATKRIAGYAFESTLVTVRPEVQGSAGTIQFELKNAKDAEVRVLDSSDFSCRAVGVPPVLASAANMEVEVSQQDGTVELASGDYKLVLAGDSTGDGRVEVKSDTVLPLNILSISVDYEIQPLSESEG